MFLYIGLCNVAPQNVVIVKIHMTNTKCDKINEKCSKLLLQFAIKFLPQNV